jgi:hypothetical protein
MRALPPTLRREMKVFVDGSVLVQEILNSFPRNNFGRFVAKERRGRWLLVIDQSGSLGPIDGEAPCLELEPSLDDEDLLQEAPLDQVLSEVRNKSRQVELDKEEPQQASEYHLQREELPSPILGRLRDHLEAHFPVLYARVLEPTLADLHEEHSAALAEGNLVKARCVFLRGCASLASAAVCQLGFSVLNRIATLWRARSLK